MDRELMQKIKDPKFYLENFTKIKVKAGGLAPFILNDAQKDFFNTLKNNRRVIINKARQIGFCLDKDTKILSSNLEWITLEDIKIGQEIIAVDENSSSLRGSSRKMKTAVVENKFDVFDDAIKITLDNGEHIIATPDHRLLSKDKHLCSQQWRKAKDLKIGQEIRCLTSVWKDGDFEDGKFGGIIDGEGHLSKPSRTGVSLTISQVSGSVWDFLVRYVVSRGIQHRFEIDKRLPGKSSKLGSKEVNKLVIGRTSDVIRVIGQTRPVRFLGRKFWENKILPSFNKATIISIEHLPKRRMIDLQTSAKTYIANGFVSHNSSAATGWIYHKAITTPGINCALIGYNSDLVSELLDKVKTFWRTTPEELRPTIQYNSKFEISFPKMDSKILVLPSTENVGRGYTLQHVLCTEVAFWDKDEEKMVALENSVPADGGTIIVESCVTEDTIVLTDDGPRFFKDIHNWDKKPLGFSKGKKLKLDGHYGLKSVSDYYNSGIKKGYRITTKHGYNLSMSSVHKLYVWRDNKLQFVKAKDLKYGDYLCLKKGQEIWSKGKDLLFTATDYGYNKKHIVKFEPKKITEDLAYLIGLIVGDGYVRDNERSNQVIISNIDEDVVNFLYNNKLGLKFKKTNDDQPHYICSNKSFVEFLRWFGIEKGVKSPKKKVPKKVFELSRENVIAFLQGLFDADGTSVIKKGGYGMVALASTSEDIINVVRVLLLNFGIISCTYQHVVRPTDLVNVSSLINVLEINNSYARMFLEKIGFRIRRKQDILLKYKEGLNSNSSDVIPGLGLFLKDSLKELGLSVWSLSNGLNCGLYSKSHNISRQTAIKILNKCPNVNSDAFKRLKEIIDYDYYYDPISKIEDIEEAVYDVTIPEGSTVVYNGLVGHQTPNGMANWYYRTWMAPDNGYTKKSYGWWWHYTEEEMDLIRRRMNNPQKFAQEYSLEFLASGRLVFDPAVVKSQGKNIKNVGDTFVSKEGVNCTVYVEDDLRIYVPPQPGAQYIVGVDTSEGVEGGDYSIVTILNRATGEEVAFYRGLIPPDKLGEVADKWGRKYNDALMVVEVNNHGLTVLTILKQKMYPTLYFRPSQFETISTVYSERIGWKTTMLTRPLLIDDLSQALREGVLTIHSKETVNEMTTFIYDKNNKAIAMSGMHDDAILALGICFQGFKIMYSGSLEQVNYNNHLPMSFNY